MTRRPRIGAVGTSLAVSMALLASGCGSSSSSSSALSRAALVARVDAICKHRNEIITAAASKVLAGGSLPTPAVFGKLAHQTIIPQYTAQIAELGALKPPSDLAARYQAWLAGSRATRSRMLQNPRIITSSANFVTVNGQAHTLGFSSNCNVGPG